MICKNTAILQPEVPHYRTEFFRLLEKECQSMDIYIYNSVDKAREQGFMIDDINLKYISNIQCKGILFYNPFTLLHKKYDTLVVMWHFAHVTTWLLLLTKWIHRKKIIIWGQGISVKRYMKEEKKPNVLMKWMLALADGAWIYMEKEAGLWKGIFPKKRIVALNNTLSGAEEITKYKSTITKEELKEKYDIKESVILLFCARFTNPYRRTDLLTEVIEQMDKDKFGFVIIGNGPHKPDFSSHSNVYDFGAVYDKNIKQDLFTLSDIYFQPGWVGLSIVEAMAHGKPIFTFERNAETLQCVEYSYIINDENGMIFENTNDCIEKLNTISKEGIAEMGECAKKLVKEKLTINNMVRNACSIL